MLMVNKAVAHPWMCDVLGHLTTRHYLAMFDDASYHLFSSIFGWPGATTSDGKLGWVDVRQILDYMDEVKAGETLEVTAGVLKLGSKSITVRYTMTNRIKNETAAMLDSISVFFDLENRESLVIPDDLRAQAEEHMLPAEE